MQVETFPVGMLLTNCYVVNCTQTKEAIIIDPGIDFADEAQPIFSYIEKEGLKIKGIVNTHGHQDHIKGDGLMQKQYNCPIYIHENDAYWLTRLENINVTEKVLLKDHENIQFGKVCLKVMHTPGHTMGSICLIDEKIMFSGDTLFSESIGRTDFAESSPKDMNETLQKLTKLPDELLVYPGHDEATTISHEKHANPFLKVITQ
ncbi:MAG: MBL fold metallo-hydrolase [Nitrososphaerota archaeon]|jgi:glyoxylase-like metal-dependent hydrolase (beta-lactamase superfamily II)|uniref:MBL fold metallo-hydrolase n=1 Tax=Candidatus Bathycorpusculum sp. TaxID=2994959 RepID=UPI0028310668|nr:MBL fold metallo-hydrolase [Candidatus Termiticorpusculum sp.]MCL2257590.1 MBL fold metallo-hydrolase [Candidatus Termiticorpusculum sp.]MCL2292278.1 MBL fold metallo-hydrolase [Candidatus Termiticorpusculum sp.]MDR0460211.1 MBL fold metallo-hydrolase [Nitrososphaerota archaeon]